MAQPHHEVSDLKHQYQSSSPRSPAADTRALLVTKYRETVEDILKIMDAAYLTCSAGGSSNYPKFPGLLQAARDLEAEIQKQLQINCSIQQQHQPQQQQPQQVFHPIPPQPPSPSSPSLSVYKALKITPDDGKDQEVEGQPYHCQVLLSPQFVPPTNLTPPYAYNGAGQLSIPGQAQFRTPPGKSSFNFSSVDFLQPPVVQQPGEGGNSYVNNSYFHSNSYANSSPSNSSAGVGGAGFGTGIGAGGSGSFYSVDDSIKPYGSAQSSSVAGSTVPQSMVSSSSSTDSPRNEIANSLHVHVHNNKSSPPPHTNSINSHPKTPRRHSRKFKEKAIIPQRSLSMPPVRRKKHKWQKKGRGRESCARERAGFCPFGQNCTFKHVGESENNHLLTSTGYCIFFNSTFKCRKKSCAKPHKCFNCHSTNHGYSNCVSMCDLHKRGLCRVGDSCHLPHA